PAPAGRHHWGWKGRYHRLRCERRMDFYLLGVNAHDDRTGGDRRLCSAGFTPSLGLSVLCPSQPACASCLYTSVNRVARRNPAERGHPLAGSVSKSAGSFSARRPTIGLGSDAREISASTAFVM